MGTECAQAQAMCSLPDISPVFELLKNLLLSRWSVFTPFRGRGTGAVANTNSLHRVFRFYSLLHGWPPPLSHRAILKC